MGIQGTYEQLFLIRQDIMKQSNEHPSFAYLNRGKLKAFFNLNDMRLRMMDDELKAIYDEHVAKDANGVYEKHVDGKDWVYNSQEDAALFKQRFHVFMSREITINY